MERGVLVIGAFILVSVLAIGYYFYDYSTDMNDDGVTETISYMDVSAAEAKAMIDSKPELVVIDVSPYYAEGHLPGAINYYPSSALDDAIASGELDANAEYLVYCHVDSASRNGAQKLVDARFENVYRLKATLADGKKQVTRLKNNSIQKIKKEFSPYFEKRLT